MPQQLGHLFGIADADTHQLYEPLRKATDFHFRSLRHLP
jgi:hypothetical protein